MQPREKAWLFDVLRAARQIVEDTRDITFEQFGANRLLRDSTLYQFIVLGEASKRISKATQEELSYLPWKAMARSRDFLAHHYDRTELETVWGSATTQVPQLIKAFEPLLPVIDPNQASVESDS